MTIASDEAEIRGLIDQFVEGWNQADGDLCGRPFANDAEFTAITGLKARGREMIAQGHTEILSTIYRDTQITGTVNAIRFLRPDVASADVTFRFTAKNPLGIDHTSLGMIATKEPDGWRIAVFRNMIPFARPIAGPLERERMPDRGTSS